MAGLSLAAATFFAPVAQKIIRETSDQIKPLEDQYERAKDRGFSEGALIKIKDQIDHLNKTMDDARTSQQGLIKAFLIFVGFVAHSISLDQAINQATVGTKILLQYGDVAISITLLTAAGIYLWRGAWAIGQAFNVNFDEEKRRIDSLKEHVAKWEEHLKK